MDFEVSAEQFYRLLQCDTSDQSWFRFERDHVASRWEESPPSSAEMADVISFCNAGRLDFPALASRVYAWYLHARSFIKCSLPACFANVLAASNYDAAVGILTQELRDAELDSQIRTASFVAIPTKPVHAHFVAQLEKDDALASVAVIHSCIEALASFNHGGSDGSSPSRAAEIVGPVSIRFDPPPIPLRRRGPGILLNAALVALKIPLQEVKQTDVISWLRTQVDTGVGKTLGIKLEHDCLMYYDSTNGNTIIDPAMIRGAIRNAKKRCSLKPNTSVSGL